MSVSDAADLLWYFIKGRYMQHPNLSQAGSSDARLWVIKLDSWPQNNALHHEDNRCRLNISVQPWLWLLCACQIWHIYRVTIVYELAENRHGICLLIFLHIWSIVFPTNFIVNTFVNVYIYTYIYIYIYIHHRASWTRFLPIMKCTTKFHGVNWGATSSGFLHKSELEP